MDYVMMLGRKFSFAGRGWLQARAQGWRGTMKSLAGLKAVGAAL